MEPAGKVEAQLEPAKRPRGWRKNIFGGTIGHRPLWAAAKRHTSVLYVTEWLRVVTLSISFLNLERIVCK